jgi:hypothetical protein
MMWSPWDPMHILFPMFGTEIDGLLLREILFVSQQMEYSSLSIFFHNFATDLPFPKLRYHHPPSIASLPSFTFKTVTTCPGWTNTSAYP